MRLTIANYLSGSICNKVLPKRQLNKQRKRHNMDNDKIKMIINKVHNAAWLAIEANTNTNNDAEVYNKLYNVKLNEIKTLLEDK